MSEDHPLNGSHDTLQRLSAPPAAPAPLAHLAGKAHPRPAPSSPSRRPSVAPSSSPSCRSCCFRLAGIPLIPFGSPHLLPSPPSIITIGIISYLWPERASHPPPAALNRTDAPGIILLEFHPLILPPAESHLLPITCRLALRGGYPLVPRIAGHPRPGI